MAKAGVGTLVVSVVADAMRFRADLRGAGNDAAKASQSLQSKLKPGLDAALKSVAALTAAFLSFRSVLADLNRLTATADFADRIGVSVERLQELQFAAEQSGVSVQTLQMAMQRSTRRIAEAAQGTGEAVDALKELGLSAKALQQLSPDQQMLAIAQAMRQVSTQGDRVRLAMKLFDSEGVALVQTFDDLEEAMRRAGMVGAVFDQEDVESARETANTIKEAEQAWRAFKTNLSVALAPALKDVANDLSDILVLFRGITDEIRDIEKLAGGLDLGSLFLPQSVLADISRRAQRGATGNIELSETAKAMTSLGVELGNVTRIGAGIADAIKTTVAATGVGAAVLPAAVQQQNAFEVIRRGTERALRRGDPFTGTMGRGSQAELRARFLPQARRAEQDAQKKIARNSDRTVELLETLARELTLDELVSVREF